MLRVVTLNLNGIRSARQKGFYDWLAVQCADVVCLQEVKAQHEDLDEELRAPGGCHGCFHLAQKKGYSGVALYARRCPDRVVEGLGDEEFDAEGRYLQADFGSLSVVSLYLPSGSSSPERQAAKFRFMQRFEPQLARLAAAGREILLCGDWNIAHRAIDLKNWRSNQKNSGFLPEERAWMDRVFGEWGWHDVFRRADARSDQYTWWSNRGQAWAKNVGWRIDYQVGTGGIAHSVQRVEIYKASRFSDHAPLVIDYDWPA